MAKITDEVLENQKRLAAFTFFAKSHQNDVCGINGLPLTLNSIRIVGNAQFLKTISNPNLVEYLDFVRGKHDRVLVVSEYFGQPLSETIQDSINLDRLFYQASNGLQEIDRLGLVHHNLEPDNVLIDDNGNVKLFNYGLFYMTKGGELVNFPIGNVKYLAPERILGGKNNIKSDIWSLGIIVLELYYGIKLWTNLKVAQVLRKILSLCNTKNILEKLARENNFLDKYNQTDETFIELLSNCLTISPEERFSPEDVLNHRYFYEREKFEFHIGKREKHPLFRCPLKHIYYWWQLAGGDINAELKEAGIIRSEAPILIMPHLALLNEPGKSLSRNYLYDNRIVLLSLKNLIGRLKNVDKRSYFPLIHYPQLPKIVVLLGMESLPLMIREKNIEYQFHRTILFRRLLKGYPFTRNMIVQESQKDIPPIVRGEVWACLLGVLPNGEYEKIDKFTPTSTDRQIEVDIPRCHQYDELLSSTEGHRKLKRLLKAWVTSHPQYVYWQGLDSLTAPFLYLNFNNEERAFMSLFKFIPKYLQSFFLKDNSAVIKEYLSKFSQLTVFHEPILAKHLADIHFIPELFAIPWFLTMFSHVFPIHKILHLWDKLMLGDHSYPLFIGIAILKQLKSTLLASGFNECILLFSDLPDIVMDNCVAESQKMYQSTPKSVTHRKHVIRSESEKTPLDIDDSVELSDLQREICPRISANDVIQLVADETDSAVVIDLRTKPEFRKSHIYKSINIPFNSVLLGDTRLEALNVADLGKTINNKIVIVVSNLHENAVLFSKFLIDCQVSRVCVLHNGFNILSVVCPTILTSS